MSVLRLMNDVREVNKNRNVFLSISSLGHFTSIKNRIIDLNSQLQGLDKDYRIEMFDESKVLLKNIT